MQNLSVGILQYDIKWHDPRANHAHIKTLLARAPKVDLLILPETFNTGFSNNLNLAEVMDGISVGFLKNLSFDFNCVVIATLMIKENNNIFNRAIICSNGKLETSYDKRHLFSLSNENEFFTAGESTTNIRVKGWKIRPLICYDLRFPEISRNDGTIDILVFSANWPSKRAEHWNALLKARAIENQCFILACNRIGMDKNEINYAGESQIIDAKGNILISTRKEELVHMLIDKKEMYSWREKLPALQDKKESY